MGCFMNRVQKYMKLRILLATAALLSTTCSACTFYANALKLTQTHALASVAVGYAEVGLKDKASEILTQALENAKAIEDLNNKKVALNQIAIKYAEAGQYDQAPTG
jgi:tetratricopeptide (TPR) repeat protein